MVFIESSRVYDWHRAQAYDYNIVKRLYVSAPMTRSSIGVPTYEFSTPVHQGTGLI